MRTTIIFLVSSLLCAACGHPRNVDKYPASVERVISLEKALDNPIRDFADFIDTSWLVALHSPEDYLQGYITKIRFHGKKIYTLDEIQSRSLNVYDQSGNFIRQLGMLGNGPQEVLNISDFDISDNKVYIVDNRKSQIQVFDTDSGAHIRTIPLPFRPHEFSRLPDGTFLFKLAESNTESGYVDHTFLLTDSLLNPLEFLLPRSPMRNNQGPYISVNNSIIGRRNGVTYAFSPQKDYIYACDSKGMKESIAFDFGARYEIPYEKRENAGAFDKYSNFHSYAYLTEAPLQLGDCIVAVCRVNDHKYVILDSPAGTYSKILSADTYKAMEPMLPIGQLDDRTLVSQVDQSGFAQLSGKDTTGLNWNRELDFLLLYSRLK